MVSAHFPCGCVCSYGRFWTSITCKCIPTPLCDGTKRHSSPKIFWICPSKVPDPGIYDCLIRGGVTVCNRTLFRLDRFSYNFWGINCVFFCKSIRDCVFYL